MSDIENNLTEELNKPPETVAPEVTPELEKGTEEQTLNPPTTQEVTDWRKDQRYGRMWNKSNIPFTEDQHKVINDGFYKSYRNGEKMWEPTRKELETLKADKEAMSALAKDYGISLDKLKDVLDEHKTLKDPNNPVVSRGKYLSAWFDDPELSKTYKDKVTAFFQDLETQEMQRRYPGMNASQIQEMVELKQKVQTIEQKEQEENRNNAVKENLSLIDKNIGKAKEYAKQKGFEVTQEMENSLIDYCKKNGVLPKDVYYAFRELYDEQIDKVYVDKVKSGQLKSLDKNKTSVVLKPNTQARSGAVTGSLQDKLMHAADTPT